MKLLLIVFLALLGLAAINPPEDQYENPLVLRCKFIKSKPDIDGGIEEDTWLAAERASGFWRLNAKGKAIEQTEVMAAYDSENLYFAFFCQDKRPYAMRQNITTHDGPIWRDDCVEVYMDVNHDHKTYYHLITNTLGTKYDAIGYAGFLEWNPNWQVATSVVKKGWIVELAIPFAEMGIPAPQPGERWGFNLNRQRYSRMLERSSWAETLEHFHEPKVFGHLQFMPFF
ncbi:MAG: carbohydrate binding family 9 domain-containing protein [Calditrichia bacterium]